MRKISQKGIEKIKEWEGLVLYAYDDADTSTPKTRILPGMKISGTLTIGYGHTKGVKPGLTCTETVADQWLRDDLAVHEARVDRLVRVALNDNQFAALVSFDLNTGALEASTLLKKLNKGDYASVPTELNRWVKTTINGKKQDSAGLKARRAAEGGLWVTGSYVSSASAPATVDKPPLVTKEAIATVSGCVLTAEPTHSFVLIR